MATYTSAGRQGGSSSSSFSKRRFGKSSFGGGSGKSYGGGSSRSSSYRGRGGRGGGGGFSRGRSSRPRPQYIDVKMYTNDLRSEMVEEKTAYKGKRYQDFSLHEKLFDNIKAKKYEVTTEIQEKAIPMILEGKDVLGISATGSGKTGAFTIPMVDKLLKDSTQKLLIVAPTRELAVQIATEATSFVKGTGLYVATVIGGQSMRDQIFKIKQGGQIVVGTPGRLNDLIKRGSLKAAFYNNIVIDEVDRMLDMGFIDDIKFMITKLAGHRQTLFFSATLNTKVEKIVASISSSYTLIRLSGNTPNKSVVQSVIDYTHAEDRIEKLEEVLNRPEVEKALIFVDTKRFADSVDKILYQKRFKVGVIHGDKRQYMRKKVIDMFKDSKISILVATNVAARGLDIDDITHVINLDLPQTYDEYVHRIGRTGRNGMFGTAYTFVKRSR